jgi:hypothetical protein
MPYVLSRQCKVGMGLGAAKIGTAAADQSIVGSVIDAAKRWRRHRGGRAAKRGVR